MSPFVMRLITDIVLSSGVFVVAYYIGRFLKMNRPVALTLTIVTFLTFIVIDSTLPDKRVGGSHKQILEDALIGVMMAGAGLAGRHNSEPPDTA